MTSSRLNFTPALVCVDCKRHTNQGLIYQTGSPVWQLLPLCDEQSEKPSGSDEPISLSALQYRVNEQLTVVRQLQHRRRRIARAYVRLRREHAHVKAQRALRWRLRHICQRQEEVWHE